MALIAIDPIAPPATGARYIPSVCRQPRATVAHPSSPARRVAEHQCVGRNVARDNGARTDERIFAYYVSADDRRVGADSRAALDQGSKVFVFARNMAARVDDIGKNHARPAEYIVFKRHVVVNR